MLPPATWYPDPSGRHEHRYWNGEQWTEHVADAGIAAMDPLEAVTADDAVNGALAADIASIAMASTTMANDPPQERPSDLFWRDEHDEHDEPVDSQAASGEGDQPHAGDDDDRGGQVGDAPEDPWAAAAAGSFVMPADTAADLTGYHDRPSTDEPHRESNGTAPGPGFVLLSDSGDVSATDGRVSVHGAALTVLLDHDRGVVGAVDALRRTEGACDLDPTDRSSWRRVTGDGSVTLVGAAPVVLVAVTGGCDVVVAADPLIALDTATILDAVSVKGEGPRSFLTLAAPAWLALAPADMATIEVVAPGHDVLVRRGRLLAWTAGVAVVGTRQGLRCSGAGQVLLAGRA